jgi:hypothetical protein
MPKRFSTHWYQEGPEFTQTSLYNLRDNDVQEGGKIPQGANVQGSVGFVGAETEVFGWTGEVVSFSANRPWDSPVLFTSIRVHSRLTSRVYV